MSRIENNRKINPSTVEARLPSLMATQGTSANQTIGNQGQPASAIFVTRSPRSLSKDSSLLSSAASERPLLLHFQASVDRYPTAISPDGLAISQAASQQHRDRRAATADGQRPSHNDGFVSGIGNGDGVGIRDSHLLLKINNFTLFFPLFILPRK